MSRGGPGDFTPYGGGGFEDARGAGRNPNIGQGGRRTGRGYIIDVRQNPSLPDYMTRDWLGKTVKRNQGNADKILKSVKKDLDRMPPKERAKAVRAIKTAAHKHNQGGGTPYSDSKGY